MRWANDSKGNPVDANDPVDAASQFTCRTCKQPVFYRRGFGRSACFAHYSLGANWVCVDYSPGSGEPQVTSVQTHGPTNPKADIVRRQYVEAQRGEEALLCIDDADRCSAGLLLRMPSAWSSSTAEKIVIRTETELYQLRSKQRTSRKFLRLPWAVPVGTCEVVQDDCGLQEHINEALNRLQSSGNFFYAANGRGSLLEESDRLELGAAYWLVGQRELSLIDIPQHLTVEHHDGPREGWHKYRIVLSKQATSSSDISSIERFLNRKVRPPIFKPTLLSPLPDRFSADGAFICGTDASHFDIRWLGSSSLVAEFDGAHVPIVASPRPGTYRMENVGHGDYALKVDGQLALLIRVETIEPFRPRGVRIDIDENAYDLLTLGETASGELPDQGLRISVPSSRVWRALRINGGSIEQMPEGISWSPQEQIKRLDAGPFGYLSFDDASLPNTPILDDPRETPKRISPAIQQVVLRHAGVGALIGLSNLKTASDCQRFAHHFALQWMLPQLIRAVTKDLYDIPSN